MAIITRRSRTAAPAPDSAETASRPWLTLNAMGAVAAVAVVVLVPIGGAVYFIWPPPTTVAGYFATFHDNALVGLLNQDLLLIVDQVLMIVVTLALYVSLRQTSESWMAVALVMAVAGATLFLASNTAFDLLGLSGRYAAASSDEQRTALLAAGEATLARYQGTPFVMGYVMTAAADLVIALVMLRSPVFGRSAAYIGIAYGVTALVPPIAATGTAGLAFSFVSLVPMMAWLVLVARGLLRLNRPRA